MSLLTCLGSPVLCAGGALSSLSVNGFFDGLAGWVGGSLSWLYDTLGTLVDSPSDAGRIVGSASAEYHALLLAAPLVTLVALLAAVIGGTLHGDAGRVVRSALLSLPLVALGTLFAPDIATVILQLANALSSVAALPIGPSLRHLVGVTAFAGLPGFGVLVVATLTALGGFLLWCDLVVRAVVLALLLALSPLIIPLAVVGSLRRLAARLVETFVALAMAKVAIVVTLSLGVHELASGGIISVVTGAVSVLLAALAPFLVLRVIPLLEHSALHSLEGLRRRAAHAVADAPSSPAGRAVGALLPTPPPPGPPERAEDFGIPMWDDGEFEMPEPPTAEPGDPPVHPPTFRTGRFHVGRDDVGPKLFWHWDD